MKDMDNKVSPLKLLASLHQESGKTPTKVVPKLKSNGEIKEVILQSKDDLGGIVPPTIIRDSSFILNLNINMDAESIKDTVVRTTELLSDIATGASFLSNLIKRKKPEERVPPVKIPVLPKIRLPKL